MATIPNVWHLRKVAEASAKACDVCYKPTTSVLITPDNKGKDFFYLCPGHLKDRGFASPITDEAELAAKKRKEEMEREIEKVKVEYEEKMKRKKNQKEKKDADKSKADDKEEDAKTEKEKNDKVWKMERVEMESLTLLVRKINAITYKNVTPAEEDVPRIYALQKVFYQKRLDRMRNAEMAKRNRERLKNPSTFPSVPTGGLG